jgi:phenol hydroxylase P5 protein
VAYICGGPRFVTDTVKAPMKGRLFPWDIYREDFYDAGDRAAGTSVIRTTVTVATRSSRRGGSVRTMS